MFGVCGVWWWWRYVVLESGWKGKEFTDVGRLDAIHPLLSYSSLKSPSILPDAAYSLP